MQLHLKMTQQLQLYTGRPAVFHVLHNIAVDIASSYSSLPPSFFTAPSRQVRGVPASSGSGRSREA